MKELDQHYDRYRELTHRNPQRVIDNIRSKHGQRQDMNRGEASTGIRDTFA